MRRAHARSALRSQTFWFRKHMGPPAAGSAGDPDEYEEMTVEEILTGKGDYFPGLITLVRARARARLRARARAGVRSGLWSS